MNEQVALFGQDDGAERAAEGAAPDAEPRGPAPEGAGPAPGLDSADPDLELAARQLEASSEYRVLRRLRPPQRYAEAGPGAQLQHGLYVDVETTGLDAGRDAIIELGLVEFAFDANGTVYGIGTILSEFEDPGRPIPPEITRITGIRDAQVRGKRLPDDAVAALVERAHLIVAHNAAFDRPFLERRLPPFEGKAWACSLADVDWSSAGFESQKLEYLAYRSGFFYDGHRAANDCQAGVHLLATPLPGTPEPALASLLRNARRTSIRLWAEHSPFESKDALKERGYRWSASGRVWWRDLPETEHDAERAWLARHVYRRQVPLPYLEITAQLRYSARIPETVPATAKRR